MQDKILQANFKVSRIILSYYNSTSSSRIPKKAWQQTSKLLPIPPNMSKLPKSTSLREWHSVYKPFTVQPDLKFHEQTSSAYNYLLHARTSSWTFLPALRHLFTRTVHSSHAPSSVAQILQVAWRNFVFSSASTPVLFLNSLKSTLLTLFSELSRAKLS